MKNHDEKHTDMIRSVLPSLRRRMARLTRRQVHKRARAIEREGLSRLRSGHDDCAVDFVDGLRPSRMSEMIWDRRGADNVGPLTRRAAAVVAADPRLREVPLHEQVACFANLLPNDVIGRHAVQHIEWTLECEQRNQEWEARWEKRVAGDAEQKRQLADVLRGILADGRHRDLRLAYARAGT